MNSTEQDMATYGLEEWIHQYSDLEKDPETIAEEWTAANQDMVQEWTSVFEE